MRLPAADDLFRPTADPADPREPGAGESGQRRVRAVPEPRDDAGGAADATAEAAKPKRRSSGRVRHDEKMTVYITSDELLDLEHARLSLRREHGVAIDRGRLVREAVAIVLADLEAAGESSALVQRLVRE